MLVASLHLLLPAVPSLAGLPSALSSGLSLLPPSVTRPGLDQCPSLHNDHQSLVRSQSPGAGVSVPGAGVAPERQRQWTLRPSPGAVVQDPQRPWGLLAVSWLELPPILESECWRMVLGDSDRLFGGVFGTAEVDSHHVRSPCRACRDGAGLPGCQVGVWVGGGEMRLVEQSFRPPRPSKRKPALSPPWSPPLCTPTSASFPRSSVPRHSRPGLLRVGSKEEI